MSCAEHPGTPGRGNARLLETLTDPILSPLFHSLFALKPAMVRAATRG